MGQDITNGAAQAAPLPMQVETIEIVARREALGLSQLKLAEWLPWKSTRVSEAENGKRRWPEWVPSRITEAEELADRLAETLYEAGIAQIKAGAQVALVPTYRQDRAFWSDWPECQPLPACVHRAAAAEALKMLSDEEHLARIVEADQ